MKKIMIMAFAAALFSACNNEAENAGTETDTTTTTVITPPEDHTVVTRTPAEGDVTYRENKVQVWRGGIWVDAEDNDMKLDNGVVVYRNGKATKDGKEIELEEGVVVDRSGNIFDRTGNAIEHAWEHTKEGVKDAGKAVGNAAEKVGHKVKDAVDGDHDNDKKD